MIGENNFIHFLSTVDIHIRFSVLLVSGPIEMECLPDLPIVGLLMTLPLMIAAMKWRREYKVSL
jgi:hypothetical protein